MKWTLCYCHTLRPISILGFFVVLIPLFAGIAYLCSLFLPYTLDNSVMVQTQCQLIDTRISTRNTTVVTCFNMFKDCQLNDTLSYLKINTYLFTDYDNVDHTTEVSDQWQTEYPSSDDDGDDKQVTCYYNYCLISNDCDPKGQPLLVFRLESAFDDYSLTVTILTVSCLLIVISLTLFAVLYYAHKPRSGTITI